MLRARPLALLALALTLIAVACGGGDDGGPRSAGPAVTSQPGSAADAESWFVTIAAVGDVMLGRSIGDAVREFGPTYPFAEVAHLLGGADVTFANLESPLSEGGEPAPKDFVFRGPPAAARGLAEAGIGVVSLANNHALDYGPAALADTRAALDEAGVAYVGAGDDEASARAPLALERNGLRLAFLAYVNTPADSGSGFDVASTAATADRPGVAWLDPESIASDVAAAAAQADVVIVSLHTGFEYQEQASDLQVTAARAAIDAGASLVLGHHPHVLQGIERYGDGLIIYSLGNFVFDFDELDYAQPGLPSALSVILRVGISEGRATACELVPVIIDTADGRPRPATGADGQAVLDRLSRLSDGSCGL